MGGRVAYSSSDDGNLTISETDATADNSFQGNNGIKKLVVGEGIIMDGTIQFIFDLQRFAVTSSLSDDGTLTISGDGAIADKAFKDRTDIKKVVIDEGITSIGEEAFAYVQSLTSLDLSNRTSLTSIGKNAFDACTSLKSVDISNCTSLTTIGETAFGDCGSSLTSVDLSNCTNLTTIGEYAFRMNPALKTVNLSGCTKLETIRDVAFLNNDALEQVTFGADGKAVVINGHKVLGTGVLNIRNEVGDGGVSLRCLDCVDTNYLGADGKTITVSAIPIITGLDYLAAGTYVVKDTLELENVTLNGEVNLILADGASLTADAISGGTLNVFSQGGETATLGKLTATTISSTFNYNVGNVTATTISGATNLNWTSGNDSINASYTGTVSILNGKRFYDNGGNIITSEVPNGQLNALDSYLIELPTGVTITGATQINTTNKYVCKSGATVTISGFNSGEISFDPLITSLAKSGDNIVVKAGDDTAVTISGLTFPRGSNSWKTEETSSSYVTKYTVDGALISDTDTKIVWGTPDDEILVTVTGLTSGVTVNDTNITVSVDDTKLTINDEALLTDGATISATNGYKVELNDSLAPSNTVSQGWDSNNYYLRQVTKRLVGSLTMAKSNERRH